jgi:YidC/Oxa1 family membrane protein insertase
MDRRTAIAVALCVLFLLAYQPLLRMAGLGHYLSTPRPTSTAVVDSSRFDSLRGAVPIPADRDNASRDTSARVVATLSSPGAPTFAREYSIETSFFHIVFSSRGAQVSSIELKQYAAGHTETSGQRPVRRPKPGQEVPPGQRVVLSGGPSFALDLGSGPSLRSLDHAVYDVAESLDVSGMTSALTFTLRDSSGLYIRQTYRVRPAQDALDLEVELRGVPAAWRVDDYSLTTRSWPTFTESDRRGDERALRATSLLGTNIHREHATGLLKGAKHFDGNVEWAGVQTRYFLSAVAVEQASARGVISRTEQNPITGASLQSLAPGEKPVQNVAINSLVAALPSEKSPINRYLLYFGPSEYQRLAKLDHHLDRAVDLGWNWILPISQLLLRVLNWVYGLVRNYGVAILVLATLVRLLLHPLNMTSIKSMRAMQRLQPEMDRIKEKYKNDPTAMNTAVMALYKENKVNPAGGCLPMVVQMPFFLALYQVLFNAIELRQAPFMLWMTDLSAPDHLFSVAGFPVRLLPLLMAGSGLLQQKLTPTNPQQAPTAYMMNVIMLVFFYNLPSGLVLYWTVMNLLNALQQWLALRHDERSFATVVETEPDEPRRKRKSARG